MITRVLRPSNAQCWADLLPHVVLRASAATARGVGPVLFWSTRAMPDLTQLIDSWGYAAIFLIVLLGNAGLPVPEETVLTVAGYLCWQRQLRFTGVVITGIASAVIGDNLVY